MKIYLITTIFILSSLCAHAQVEDYLQYAPSVTSFAIPLTGVKPKHEFKDRAFVTGFSWGMVYGITGGLKLAVSERRPDGSNYNSFPSGHAAKVFCGANNLMHEYGKEYPWLAVAGYTTAVVTATLRVTGDHHYTHDVLAGAAIGVLSSETAYLLLPVWQKMTRKYSKNKRNSSEVILFPQISADQLAMGGVVTF